MHPSNILYEAIFLLMVNHDVVSYDYLQILVNVEFKHNDEWNQGLVLEDAFIITWPIEDSNRYDDVWDKASLAPFQHKREKS